MPRPLDPSPTLIVLRITLAFWEEDPQVELVLTRGSKEVDCMRIWRVQASGLGVPASLGSFDDPASVFNLPRQVTEDLRDCLAKEPKALPLWIRFAKPHGYLGVLPWERVLTEALARPVLRLPDLLERPNENRGLLEVAVCFDAAPETAKEKVVAQIQQLIDTIFKASPRPKTSVDLFTTANWSDCVNALRFDSRLRVHEPSEAPTRGEAIRGTISREQGPSESPWSIWITQSLRNRSLDAIHFICRSDVDDSGPDLMVSSSPSPKQKMPSLSYFCAADVAALMTRTGAWAALFSTPPDFRGTATLALMADALAHTRPASVLYQPFLAPEHLDAMRLAYEFLFSPESLDAPLLSDGFLYCQPTAVAAYGGLQIPRVLDNSQSIPVDLELPTNWAASIERHIEMIALNELRRNSADVLLSAPECDHARTDTAARLIKTEGVEETLEKIHKVSNEYLKNSRL